MMDNINSRQLPREYRIANKVMELHNMDMSKHLVYTSCKELIGKEYKKGSFFRDYNEMNKSGVSWVNDNMSDLLLSRTIYELKMRDILSTSYYAFYTQVFFCIYGHFYFLDFFIPQLMIAIELDGSSHKGKKKHDNERDRLFDSVGIKTLRYSNKRVGSKSIKNILNNDVRKALCVTDNAEPKSSVKKNSIVKKKADNNTLVRVDKKDKETYNHYAIRVLAEAMEGIEDGNKVLIDTKQTYIVDTLDNINIEKSEWIKSNKDVISRFYDIVKSKNILWKVRYVGVNDSIRNRKTNKCRIYPLDYKIMLRVKQGDGVDVTKLRKA